MIYSSSDSVSTADLEHIKTVGATIIFVGPNRFDIMNKWSYVPQSSRDAVSPPGSTFVLVNRPDAPVRAGTLNRIDFGPYDDPDAAFWRRGDVRAIINHYGKKISIVFIGLNRIDGVPEEILSAANDIFICQGTQPEKVLS